MTAHHPLETVPTITWNTQLDPEPKTSVINPTDVQAPGRDHLGMMAGFKSE
jgi:hypothetical protein